MAKSRGYNNIIVIDISGAGINRKPDITGTRTVYIKNSINMGGVLDFDKKFMESFKTLGYLDTMKTFGCLRGIDYFIEPDATLEKDFHDFMKTEVIQQKLFTLPLTRKSGGRAPRNLTEAVSRLLPKKRRHDPVWLPLFVDCAANILAVEQVRKWQYQDLFNTIIEKEAEVQAEAENLEKSSNREFASRIRKDLKERKLIGNPYIYSLMGDRYLPGRLKISLEKFVIEHYPELAAGVFFIEVLEEFRMYLQGARV